MRRCLYLSFLIPFLISCAQLGPSSEEQMSAIPRVAGDADLPAYVTEPVQLVETHDDIPTQAMPAPVDDVWERIRRGFTIADAEHPRIKTQLDWYVRHQDYLDRVADRAQPYMHFIVETLEENDIPLELALLPIVESAFKPFAYSHGRASGIWQFIPSTGRRYGLTQNWWYDGRRDVYAATHAAVRLLLALKRDFKGDWLLALAAYNSGSGTVKKSIRRNRQKGKPTDFWSLDLPTETEAYVPKLLALQKIVRSPMAHGIELTPIPNEPYLDHIDVGSQIDLAVAAEMAEIDLEELYELNPGYNRWATAPNGPNYLLLPLSKSEQFKQRLAELPEQDRVRWVRYKIKEGETISTIAAKHHTSIRTIKRVNRIRGNSIRAGRSLTIPVASQSLRNYKLSKNQRKKQLQDTPRRGTKVNYIVQDGDTFWDLARAHNVGVRQLARWNGMAPRDPLTPGQKLVIWSRSGFIRTSANHNDVAAPPNRQLTKRIGYRVRRGDSLARISQKFKVSIGQLKRWNKSRLVKGNLLRPGQYLTLFVDVMRQSGS